MLDELLEGRIRRLFLFKLVLAKQLVRAILDERLKLGDVIEKYVADSRDDGLLLLTSGQRSRQASVHRVHFLAIRKDESDEFVPPVLPYRRAIRSVQWIDPEVAKILEILHKVTLCIHELGDDLLPSGFHLINTLPDIG